MKILFTTPIMEHPAAGGPQLRIENSIKALSKMSELHIISRVSRRSLGGNRAEDFYKGLCKKFVYVPRVRFFFENKFCRDLEFEFNKKFLTKDADFIINYAEKNDIDLIWFGYGNISFALMKTIKSRKPEFKIVCDTDSVWSRFVLRGLPYENNEQRRLKIQNDGKKKEQEEQEWVKFCDVTTAVSEVDAEYYKSLTDRKKKIKIFSNVIDLNNYKGHVDAPHDFRKPCIYLAGSFGPDSPMDKAARWIIERVWPQIKREIPGIYFYIIGNGSKETLHEIKDDSIIITGKLETVLPYLKNVDLAMVPLFFESGTRFKILEAAACEIPIISTTLGAEGIPVTNNQDIVIADTPEAFTEGILKILRDHQFSNKIARNCKMLVQEKYSVEKLTEEGEEIIKYLFNE